MNISANAGDRTPLKTGVPGLDVVLVGGLERDRLYLLEGTPGSGKTTLGMQFLQEGASLGERCLYITLSETEEELRASARSHGWDLEGVTIVEVTPLEADPDQQQGLIHPSEMELGQTVRLITDTVEAHKPQRLIIDALTELRLLAVDPFSYRRQILTLKRYFSGLDCAVLALDDLTDMSPGLQLHSVVHGVIGLEQRRMEYGIVRRRLAVIKLRGVDFRSGYHDYVIRTGGLIVYPSLVASEHALEFAPTALSSGVPAIDDMLGGGLRSGTSTLLIGPSGVGKSTLAIQYALASTDADLKAAVFAFDENYRTAAERAKGLGMDLEGAQARGNLLWVDLSPTNLSPGEFVDRVQRQVDAGARVVVIDSLNSYIASMPEEKSLILHMHELLAYLGNQGVVTVLIMAQHGLVGETHAPLDLSFMADTVVILRYFEAGGQVRKAISVLKSRSGQHESTIREYNLSSKIGVGVGEPIRAFQGVLSGVPQFIGTASALAKTEEDG
ncbi:MAG TPA: ATPase domain-containing protein [Caulobacteraceae bacterium]|jgi:circadian clock protein KaiC